MIASTIYSAIETLGAATDLDEIRAYAKLPDQIDATIESLRVEIDALNSTNLQAELKRARDRAAVIESTKVAIEGANSFDIATYSTHRDALEQATRHHEEAGTKAFEGLQIPGLLSHEWRRFLEAGEEYVRQHEHAGYPASNDACAYCRQPLIDEALELLKKYREFLNNEIRGNLNAAQRVLRDYISPILNLPLDRLEQSLISEIMGARDVLESLKPSIQRIRQLQTELGSQAKLTWLDKNASLATAGNTITVEEAPLRELIAPAKIGKRTRDCAQKKAANFAGTGGEEKGQFVFAANRAARRGRKMGRSRQYRQKQFSGHAEIADRSS